MYQLVMLYYNVVNYRDKISEIDLDKDKRLFLLNYLR